MLKDTKIRLTKAEELDLGRVVQAGLAARKRLETEKLDDNEILVLNKQVSEGEYAHELLFESHIGMANKIASKLYYATKTGYSLEDMMQDAYLGLSMGIDTYNPAKNCALSTHAYYQISKVVSVTLNKMRSVRLPENKMGDYFHIMKAETKYKQEHQENPDPDEMMAFVTEETGLTKDIVNLIKSTIRGTMSLNTPLGEDGGEYADLLPDENAQSPMIENNILSELLSKLTLFEQDIIAFEDGIGTPSMSLSEFLVKYNMTTQELKKEYRKVVRKLKKIGKEA